MNIVHIVAGSGGGFYCQNCVRDIGLVKALQAAGHEVGDQAAGVDAGEQADADADDQGQAEALDRAGTDDVEHQAGRHGGQVRVDDGEEDAVVAGLDRCRHALGRACLLRGLHRAKAAETRD